MIENVPGSRQDLLLRLHHLVIASLRSRHSNILNSAVIMWNQAFGSAETLEYADDLRSVLMSLKIVANVDTPGIASDDSQRVSL